MTKKEIISLLILVGVLSFATYKYQTRAFTETKSQYLMDTVVEISSTSKSKTISKQIDSVFVFIKNLEAKLNEFQPDSWLSKVNNSMETSFPMDDDIYEMLVIADSLYKMTGGAFDPTIKPVWDMWGFNSESPTIPDSLEIKEELKKVGFNRIQFDKKKLVKPVEMQIALGAIAKGYILDKARAYMFSIGLDNGYISCRSSMTFFGNPIPQVVYVQHPRKTDDYIASFKILNNSVGTSGDYQQFFEINGKRYHHIINPFTGYPVEAVHSVTVLNHSAAWADGLSTALFLMQPEAAIEAVKRIPDCNAIIYYTKDGSIVSLKTLGILDSSLTEKI
ncbi:MAG: FAD:protein FMN transferase [Candidatus Cloacimonetes bacterium HGW-Cloacimonetes-3]|jgi:thiamine biosynthesis lipoprotein|nr:MAG: FAD:protein FMN transferase [Candidatus Cloacimonetes bacterium HGW-Cloacimonetes-3]